MYKLRVAILWWAGQILQIKIFCLLLLAFQLENYLSLIQLNICFHLYPDQLFNYEFVSFSNSIYTEKYCLLNLVVFTYAAYTDQKKIDIFLLVHKPVLILIQLFFIMSAFQRLDPIFQTRFFMSDSKGFCYFNLFSLILVLQAFSLPQCVK